MWMAQNSLTGAWETAVELPALTDLYFIFGQLT